MPDLIIDKERSKNFSALKLGAILMVFSGHFFQDLFPLVWLPTSVALLIFSYSSGLFTELKHGHRFEGRTFLINKLIRLGIGLAVIEAALLILFLIQGKPGIWTWQTLVNLVGMNGLLNWFRISNPSPYGRGMWFLTLLLLFYFTYPALRKTKRMQLLFCFVFFFSFCFLLDRWVNVGHSLWLTACGFISGVLAAKWDFQLQPWHSRAFCLLVLVIMIVLNVLFNIKTLNFFLIFLFSIFFIFSVQTITVGNTLFAAIGIFSGCLLEIYLLHPYLTFHPTQNLFIDYGLSLMLILVVAKTLNRTTVFFQKIANGWRHAR